MGSELVFRNTMDRGNCTPAHYTLLYASPGLLVPKQQRLWRGSHLRTPYWHCSAQPCEGIGLEGKRAERGEGVRRWAVEVIRLTPYHRRCDSTQRRIIADVIPPPAPRQRRPNRAHCWHFRLSHLQVTCSNSEPPVHDRTLSTYLRRFLPMR